MVHMKMGRRSDVGSDSRRSYNGISGLRLLQDGLIPRTMLPLLLLVLLLGSRINAFAPPNGLCSHRHLHSSSSSCAIRYHPFHHNSQLRPTSSSSHLHTLTPPGVLFSPFANPIFNYNRGHALSSSALLSQSSEKHEDYGAVAPAVNDNTSSEELSTTDSNGNDGNKNVNDPENDEEESISQAISSLALPALAALAIDPLMTLADTAFVGRNADNADALAGLGSAAAILTFSFYLFNFLCTVTTPLVSQRRASGEERDAILLGGQALSLALLLGVTLMVVLIAGSQPLLNIMGTGNTGIEANAYATSFLILRAIAAPAYFVISAATGILRGYLDTRTAFVILLLANGINFGLDVVLISGMGMGPTGAAIATTTAEWISALSFLGILAGKIPSVDGVLGSNQKMQENEGAEKTETTILVDNNNDTSNDQQDLVVVTPVFDIPTWENIQPLVIASSSAFVRSFVLQLSIAGAAAMAARSGGADLVNGDNVASASIAAHQIALQLWLLGSFVCDALAAASQALVADRLGKNDVDGVRDLSTAIFAYSLVLGLVLAAALAVGDATGFLVSFFTDDEATREAMKPLITILIAAQPLNAFVFSADGVIQGASLFGYQAKTMVLSAAVAVTSFVSLQVLADDPSMTLQHVWYGLIVLQVMRGVTSLWKLVDTEGPIQLFAGQQKL